MGSSKVALTRTPGPSCSSRWGTRAANRAPRPSRGPGLAGEEPAYAARTRMCTTPDPLEPLIWTGGSEFAPDKTPRGTMALKFDYNPMPPRPRKSAPAAGCAGPCPRRRLLERKSAGAHGAASGPRGRIERDSVSDRRPLRKLAAVFVLQPDRYTKFRGFRIGVCSEIFRGLDRFDPPASPGSAQIGGPDSEAVFMTASRRARLVQPFSPVESNRIVRHARLVRGRQTGRPRGRC